MFIIHAIKRSFIFSCKKTIFIGTLQPGEYNETMEIKQKLENALKDAMRSGDDVSKRTIRMALAAIRQAEIDRQVVLDETAILAIIQKEIKTRREAIEEARRVARNDIVTDTEAEVKVLSAYLPEALTTEALAELVREAIREIGATGVTDMGRIMKILMPRIAGRAAGDQVSAAVKQALQEPDPGK
jgi:uncharacterized protein YqeY